MLLKVAGLLFVGLIILSIVFRIIFPAIFGSSFEGVGKFSVSTPGSMPMIQDDSYAAEDYGSFAESEARLSLNNIGVPAPRPGGSVGSNAEDFEVTEYHASIETRNKENTCSKINALKDFEYVVFESVNEHDRGCHVTFKVEHEKVGEIVSFVEALNPKNLSENTYTIKQQLDDFTSETEILESKLSSINNTLEEALVAYESVTALAVRTQDAEALATIIDSKISIIERLTRERINTVAQLERLARSKAQQLDRLEYTYFSLSVYENKFIDGENLSESWKGAIKEFVRDINRVVQDVTINLVLFLFFVLQYVLYFFILLVVVKYLWRATRYVWKR